MPYTTYQEYLKSPTWIKLKNAALERDKKRCRICNSSKKPQVHHRCYPKIWGDETVDDLTTLCHRCHTIFSGKKYKKKDKLQKRKTQFIKGVILKKKGNLPHYYKEYQFDKNHAGYCQLPV